MSDFIDGARQSTAITLSTLPFAALFGAVAAAHGQTIAEAVLMSATIFAGASQLVGIELFGHDVPAWLIVLSVFAVNFRHILYSAAIGPYFRRLNGPQKAFAFFFMTDPQFAETVKHDENGKAVTFGWYMGFALAIYIPWVGFTAIGAMFSSLIGDPKSVGLDVLLPVYFMASVLSFRKRPNFLVVVGVSAVASVIAMQTVGSPWHVSLGALAGIITAALLPPPKTPDEENASTTPEPVAEAAR
ncbi:AzlC family ABC transporter permease [Allorhizobium taibaishanense]|uniref:Branched-chain amino acid ABC transporter permease n=1 Tax=Allorhizobium taibaishanense TaxID=887144 RepID=A0A1Q9A3E6_9HYPH|nr:AzlC family ABC transporter permease [Allorhizobium taibaishanense]MBB4006126.1 putative branched-subunit amino acid permease [Allorhizobium taibaishanense]OLP49125.1 branched-chain amino acid ABC transporter permease [Allorhizobium taibaishanense]